MADVIYVLSVYNKQKKCHVLILIFIITKNKNKNKNKKRENSYQGYVCFYVALCHLFV